MYDWTFYKRNTKKYNIIGLVKVLCEKKVYKMIIHKEILFLLPVESHTLILPIKYSTGLPLCLNKMLLYAHRFELLHVLSKVWAFVVHFVGFDNMIFSLYLNHNLCLYWILHWHRYHDQVLVNQSYFLRHSSKNKGLC